MADPQGLPEKTIFEEFPDWHIAPIEVGWAATRTARDGHNIHTVGVPTVHELRLRLREVSARASCSRPFLEASQTERYAVMGGPVLATKLQRLAQYANERRTASWSEFVDRLAVLLTTSNELRTLAAAAEDKASR